MAKLAREGDERGLAMAHMTMFTRYWLASRSVPAAEEVRLAAEHARNCGDDGLRERALAWKLAANLYGPVDVATMEAELEAVEADKPGPYLRGFMECGRSTVDRFQQRFESARVWALRAAETYAGLGSSIEGWGWVYVSEVDKAARDYPSAVAAAERGDRILAEAGERAFRSTTQAFLSELHELNGDRDAAWAAIELSDELSAPEDVINYAISHAVRARLALREGDLATAERWARSAIKHAYETDFPVTQAAARLALAEMHSAVGRTPEALVEARSAVEIFRAKGDLNGGQRARALLEQLEQRA
jgi:tetratricopeptide (TPR) repeat protein